MSRDELKNKIYGALSDPKAPWYGSDLVAWVGDYIEDAEKRIEELETDICPSWMGKEKGCNEAQDVEKLEAEKENLRQYASGLENAQNLITVRYRKIEAALQGMIPFIEDDFPNGTGTNHGTCATDEYQQVCDAVIKAINS